MGLVEFSRPIHQCISKEALVKLINYQWDTYGYKLELISHQDPAVDYSSETETLDDIDRIMRERPKSHKQVEV